jgi:hypothetical protein
VTTSATSARTSCTPTGDAGQEDYHDFDVEGMAAEDPTDVLILPDVISCRVICTDARSCTISSGVPVLGFE